MLLRKADPMNDSIDDPVPDRTKLIILDNEGARSGVQFKPSKKMKKRRQLDALVANEKKLPRRKHSGHELLRASNDSGSSEVEEFSILHGHKWDKSLTSSSCCFTCYTLTCVLLVTSCLLASATLVWMHLELKRDFNDLKDRLELVENKNAGTPEEFQALQSKLTLMNKSLNDIQTGKYGLQSLNKSIVSMQEQIASLTAAQQQQQQQQQTDETSSVYSKNQKEVADIVADLGSGFQTMQSEVETLKTLQKTSSTQLEDLNNRVSVLENPHGREGGIPVFDTKGLQVSLTQLNRTLTQSIAEAMVDLSKQQTHIEALDQFTQELQVEVRNTHQLAVNLTQSQRHLQEFLSQHDTSTTDTAVLTQLQNQVNQLQTTLQQMQSDQNNVTEAESPSDISSSPSASVAGDFQALIKDHEDFVLFRKEVFQDINSLNATVVSLNGTIGVLKKDVGDVSTKVSIAANNISSMATVVSGIASSIKSKDASTELAAGNDNNNSQADQSETEGGDSSASKTTDSENMTGKNIQTTTSASQSEQPQQSSSDSESSQHPVERD